MQNERCHLHCFDNNLIAIIETVNLTTENTCMSSLKNLQPVNFLIKVFLEKKINENLQSVFL